MDRRKTYTFDKVLSLGKNNFNERIPRSLCKASNLQILNVALNITRTIPHCLRKCMRRIYVPILMDLQESSNDFSRIQLS